MKIYQTGNISTFVNSLNMADAGFNFYYSDAHVAEITSGYVKSMNIHVEVSTEGFLDTFGYIGGNNNPMSMIAPEYAPYPFAGNCVIAYIPTVAGGLSVAETEMEDDFEFIAIYASGSVVGYLCWGTFKVTQTQFYTPKIGDVSTIVFQTWNPIDGLDHTTLDYSDKIGNAVAS